MVEANLILLSVFHFLLFLAIKNVWARRGAIAGVIVTQIAIGRYIATPTLWDDTLRVCVAVSLVTLASLLIYCGLGEEPC